VILWLTHSAKAEPPHKSHPSAASIGTWRQSCYRDEAFLVAVNIAKLPSVPRQILKDIPRPPNTASWDA
jgi:hypothetical protein